MVISSLVVEVVPSHTQSASDVLSRMPGVEIHGADEQAGKIVVTIEAESIDASHAVASDFIGIEGVLGISLVYANFEDENLSSANGRLAGDA